MIVVLSFSEEKEEKRRPPRKSLDYSIERHSTSSPPVSAKGIYPPYMRKIRMCLASVKFHGTVDSKCQNPLYPFAKPLCSCRILYSAVMGLWVISC